MISDPQVKRLYAIASSRGWSHDGVKRLLEFNYKVKSSRDLTPQQYEEICNFLENSIASDIVTMKRDPNTLDLFDEENK